MMSKFKARSLTSLPSEVSCGAVLLSQPRQLVDPASKSGIGAEHLSSSERSFSTKETTMILSASSGHRRHRPSRQPPPAPPPAPPPTGLGKEAPPALQPAKPACLTLLQQALTHALGVLAF
ncbi:hypothetical protein MHYP_G00027050 [Metynnis hypsauchen]